MAEYGGARIHLGSELLKWCSAPSGHATIGMGGNGRPSSRHLLSDSKVRRWFDNVARGSDVTAEICLRRLGAFCRLQVG